MPFSILQRSYDLRGIFPQEINEELFLKLWFFFWEFFDWNNIAIGYDARQSSPELKNAIIHWLQKSGKNIIDIWFCSTDMLTFSTGHFKDIDAWIMITASHNPKQYNGLKVCKKLAKPINIKEISPQIINFLNKKNITWGNIGWGWKIIKRDIKQERIKHILSFINPDSIKPLKIVVDGWNGSAWVFIEELLKQINCEIIPLFLEPDWIFPNHEANPLKPENTKDMIQKVKETKADLGVAFDGDADRMMICDENGEMLSWTIITALIAEHICKNNPKAKIISNTVCWRIIPETIKKYWWIHLRSKVWHTYIKTMMQKNQEILFAWEHSAHYFFKDNRNADSAAIALCIVLELFSTKRNKISEMKNNYDKYVSIHETNFQIKNPTPIYNKLKQQFPDWTISEEDGLLIQYPTRRFNIRASSNEPLIRLNLEADTKEILDKKLKTIKNIITNQK